jgi:hypothetical protein
LPTILGLDRPVTGLAGLDAHPRPLTAERLRTLISHPLAEHPEVIACRPTPTIYADRLALAVEDRAGLLWRVHVLTEARQ